MLWEWIVAGGMTMATLIFLSIVSIGVVLERLAFFKQIRLATAALRTDIATALEKKQHDLVLERCRQSESPLAAMILAEAASGRDAESADAERVMALTLRGELSRLKQYLPMLATIASIAPFVGLFGTCKGIIAAFSDIATQGMGGPSVIAAGISEALVATATGLLVAIPALMFYNYFSKAISNMALELESQAFQAYRDLRQQLPSAQK
ncbi:MAG: MotA/TolQ/ExbB proton channel family protein [Verrucomicrobia bacterium]|nr:MotA/TolQ/ExbB proton channel family protein [Verrucomicrobiota bacterium]MBM3870233.1 MotA/TolQ/ExbB proton channel family protein [Verrucomicrobiota bacterium]